MKTERRRWYFWVLSLLACLVSTVALHAAVINYVGAQTNPGSGWRTPGGSKPLDVDGDNVLGTDGYYLVNLEPALPGYVSAAAILTTTYPGNGSYAQMDNPNNLPTLFTTGTMNPFPGNGTNADVFKFVLNSNAVGQTIRVGLLVDNLDVAAYNAASLMLVQTNGAGATNGPIATTTDVFNDRLPDWLFFDITGVVAGDTFIVRGSGGVNGAATLGGVTFDSGPFPQGSNLTVLNYWRLGENDPGAVSGGTTTNTVDIVAGNNLTLAGAPAYTNQVGATAAIDARSRLALQLNGTGTYGTGTVIPNLTNNFGIECWINPASTTVNGVVVYNGNISSNGWGLMWQNGGYVVLVFGGVEYLGAGLAPANTWTHLALVRNNGTTTVYLNGTPAVTSTSAPQSPTGNMLLGADNNHLNKFAGLIDEVRVFTFPPGQFQVTNLLWNQTNYRVNPVQLEVINSAGSDQVALTTLSNTFPWTATANVSWLHLAATDGLGGTNLVFSFDANVAPNAASRTGTLTVAGRTVTVVQTAFAVNPAFLTEPLMAGTDQIVLSATPDLGTWTATANISWLHLAATNGTGNTNLVFNFDANLGPNATNRTGTLTVAGQTVTVVQAAPSYGVNPLSLMEPLTAGTDSISLTVAPSTATWTTTANVSWLHLAATNGTGSTNLVFNFDANLGPNATNRTGTLTVAGQTVTVVQAAPSYGVDPVFLMEPLTAGTDSISLTVAPSMATWTATANLSWLHLAANGTGSTNLNFSFDANPTSLARVGTLSIATQTVSVTQAGKTALGTTNLTVGPAAGSNSVVLSISLPPATWTATANVSWLHLAATNGTGSTNVVFSCDSNPGATRTGTLMVAGLTLTVTQAGSAYVAAGATTLVSQGLNFPTGIAVDGSGNVYIADTGNHTIKEWIVASNVLTTLVPPGQLITPEGVTVDGAGNVYIADIGIQAIKVWVVASNLVTTLVPPGSIYYPVRVAVDGAGNVYIADEDNQGIQEWVVASNLVTTLVPPGPEIAPFDVAVDGAGNLYFTDGNNAQVDEWRLANNELIPLFDWNYFLGTLAVDGGGNVYTINGYATVTEWVAADRTTIPRVFVGSTSQYEGLAVDGPGNLFISRPDDNQVWELPRAFLDPTTTFEAAASGSDALPPIVPATFNLTGPFAPVSDSPWLTIMGATNGVVSFSCTENSSGTNRTAHIALLGQAITVTQYSYPTLNPTSLLEGPTAGIDAVVVAPPYLTKNWTATANNPWLQLGPPNPSGANGITVPIAFAANTGGTRTGTLSIVGQTVTLTQAGSTYVPAGLIQLAPPSDNGYRAVAVDGAGNVYFAEWGSHSVKEWLAASNLVIDLVSSGLSYPQGVAVDGAGNVYISYPDNAVIKEWVAASQTVTNLFPSGLVRPGALAVDGAGNVYFVDIMDISHKTVKEWLAANRTVTNVITSGLVSPHGIAVDGAGNVYVADASNNAILEWVAASQTLTNLISGINAPYGVAVDSAGNVYLVDISTFPLLKWVAASQTLTALPPFSPGSYPEAVAVDRAGNVYTAGSSVFELPRVFLDPTFRVESVLGGSDGLPPIVPATFNLTGPFAPAGDSPWLTINAVTNGVVGFSVTPNNGPYRGARLTMLGQDTPIVQAGAGIAITGVTQLGDGTIQFSTLNNSNATCTVLSTTNLALPMTDWTVIGVATYIGADTFQFAAPTSTDDGQRFFGIRSP